VLGDIKEGERVAIWGCGPIGLYAAKWAQDIFKASHVYLIDDVEERLNFALNKLEKSRLTVINFKNRDTIQALHELCPGGPDVVIDAAGFRYAKSTLQKVERAFYLETDACDVLTEALTCVRKVISTFLVSHL
jgi:threonine dehydrogenase-like Zn-dependent dehydrogenase